MTRDLNKALVTLVTLVLGTRNVLSAAAGALGTAAPGEALLFALAGGVALVLAVPVARAVRRGRAGAPPAPAP